MGGESPLSLTTFTVLSNPSEIGARIGRLDVPPHSWRDQSASIPTPYVFPVINIIGGPAGPERNGGIWRPIKWWMFLHERMPAYLCQVLHVLDFNLSNAGWEKWRTQSFSQWVAEWQRKAPAEYACNPSRHDTGYPFRSWMRQWGGWDTRHDYSGPAPITFLDSGGYTLLTKEAFKWADWLDATPEGILDLQLQLGGDLIASLDYPLPSGLSYRAAHKRQLKSAENGLELLRLLTQPKRQGATPLPYVAVHGISRKNAYNYVRSFFSKWEREQECVRERPFGLAIGSMVPRADDPRTVVEIAWGVREGIRDARQKLRTPIPGNLPIHMFGITSHLVGFLAYMGVDTFDSQTYADQAKRARYLDADLRDTRIGEVTDQMLNQCNCEYCRRISDLGILPQIKEILDKSKDVKRTHTIADDYHELLPGEFCTKSDLYALLAMHNWHRISREIDQVKQAVQDNRLHLYLAEIVREHGGRRADRLGDALAWMAQEEERELGKRSPLKEAMRTVLDKVLVPRATGSGRQMDRQPKDFTVPADYQAPKGKVMLLMACTKGKPYSRSQHQRPVLERIKKGLGDGAFERLIHKVTLSGLYGPVPMEDENREQVLDYNYRLEPGDSQQVALLEERLRAYLQNNAGRYKDIVAYVYASGYREVVEKVFRELNVGVLVPAQVRRGSPTAAYQRELMQVLAGPLGVTFHGTKQLRLPLGTS